MRKQAPIPWQPTFKAGVFLALSGVLLLAAAFIAGRQANRPAWQRFQRAYYAAHGMKESPHIISITPTLTGKPELCLTCHIGLAEISPSHPVEAFGCTTCHGGDPLALDEKRAHASLRGGRNPSDLAVVQQSCGGNSCHSDQVNPERDHIGRVLKSVQATYAGGIATVRYAFGAQTSRRALYGVEAVQDNHITTANGLPSLAAFPTHSAFPVDREFQQNCLTGGCHLWTAPTPQPYRYRAGGCAACHYLYDDDGLYRGSDPTISPTEPGHGAIHRLTTEIPFTQCNHCHNRGNYSLKRMQFALRPDLPPAGPTPAPWVDPWQQRLHDYYQPIGTFTRCEWELDCIDCHTSQEAMGDGDIHSSKYDIQYIQCATCHGTPDAPPHIEVVTREDEVALRQAQLNSHYNLHVGDRVVTTRRGEKLGHIRMVDGRLILIGKVTGKVYTVPLVQGSNCAQSGADQSSGYCHQCHYESRDHAAFQHETP